MYPHYYGKNRDPRPAILVSMIAYKFPGQAFISQIIAKPCIMDEYINLLSEKDLKVKAKRKEHRFFSLYEVIVSRKKILFLQYNEEQIK